MTKIMTPLITIGVAVGCYLAGFSQLKAQSLYVAVGNDLTDEYEVYDPDVTDWNSETALKWTFAPTTAGGWNSSEIAAWSNPTECKLRWSGANQVVACSASGGLVTVATYPGGTMVWAQDVGGSYNPHSAEYLPNGNVAVAAADGNFVRVYAASQGNRNGTYAQFSLVGAHSVLWDPQNNVLWALGTSALVELSIGGTAANPTLSQVNSVSLPATAGHDLSPFYGDPDKLWVTVSLNAYIYSKSASTFTGAPGSANRSAVKGCGNQPSGEIVQCQQDNSVCTLNTWCTPNVNFFTIAGSPDYTRTRTGAAFYKCRIFTPDYQPQSLRIDVVVQGSPTNSDVDEIAWNEAGGWTGWTGLGQLGSGRVAICSYAYQYLNVFARGTDNALWTKYYSPATGWSPTWTSLGGHMASDPCAIAWQNHTINVFYQGTNNQIVQRYWNGSWNTNGEIALGGTPIAGGAPAVCSFRDGWLNLFIRGTDNALWTKSFSSSGWSGWSSLGGVLASDPGACAWTTPYISVFVQGSPLGSDVDGITWNGSAWSSWYGLGAMGTGVPAACSYGPGFINVYARGSDNALWTQYYANGAWEGAWTSLGGILTSDPGCVSWDTGD